MSGWDPGCQGFITGYGIALLKSPCWAGPHLSGWGHTLFVCLFEGLIGWSVRKAEVFIHFLCGTFAEVSLQEHGTG